MIEVKDLRVRFGRKTVLKDVDVTIDKGEFVIIAGNNGAGKSTFLRTLMGIVTPVKGKVNFESGLTHKECGFLSDGFSFFEDFTLREGIAFHKRVYGLDTFDDTLVSHLDLDLDARVKTLSMGERVIYLFSLIMSQKPKLILVDEILHAIDPYIRELFLEYLLDIIHRFDTTVITVNHIFSEIETIPGRVLVMENGKFVLNETTEELKARMKRVDADVQLPPEIPVLYKKKVLNFTEYYVYPFNDELGGKFDHRFQDLTLTEIIKAFIGGYYVKKRTSRNR